MCRAFRHLPLASKQLVFEYGLKQGGAKKQCLVKPPVTYCSWSWKHADLEDDEEDE